jgi:hypothetical protein
VRPFPSREIPLTGGVRPRRELEAQPADRGPRVAYSDTLPSARTVTVVVPARALIA